MFLKAVEIEDFLPFGKVGIDIPNEITCLVEGDNGAGKSALFEAVYWCVTGKTIRSIPVKEIPRHGSNGCYVATCWDLPNPGGNREPGEWWISREWSKGKGKVNIWREDDIVTDFHTVDAGTKAAMELLNVTPDILNLVMFFGSRRYVTFSGLKPAERAAIFDDIANGAKWEVARKRAAVQAKELDKDFKRDEEQFEEIRDDIKKLHEEKEKIEENLKEAEAEHDKILKEIDDDIKVLTKDIDSAESEIGELAEGRASAEATVEKLENQLSVLRDKRTKAQERLRHIELEYDKAADLLDNKTCPVCMQSMGKAVDFKKHLNELYNTFDNARAEYEQRKKDYDKKNVKLGHAKDEYHSINDQYGELEAEVRQLTTALNRQSAKREALTQLPEVIEFKADLKNVNRQIEDLEFKKKKIRGKLVEKQNEIEAYRFWVKGMQYIRFLVLERVCHIFNGYLRSIAIDQLGLDAQDISVEMFREDSSRNQKPEVNIVIERAKHNMLFDALSDGETQRVNIACFIAVGLLISKVRGMDVGIRVLDEPLTNIKEEGKQRAFDTIASMPGASQCFVMDHSSNFADRYDRVISVERKKGGSTCEMT